MLQGKGKENDWTPLLDQIQRAPINPQVVSETVPGAYATEAMDVDENGGQVAQGGHYQEEHREMYSPDQQLMIYNPSSDYQQESAQYSTSDYQQPQDEQEHIGWNDTTPTEAQHPQFLSLSRKRVIEAEDEAGIGNAKRRSPRASQDIIERHEKLRKHKCRNRINEADYWNVFVPDTIVIGTQKKDAKNSCVMKSTRSN
jgi:hypothetical protein